MSVSSPVRPVDPNRPSPPVLAPVAVPVLLALGAAAYWASALPYSPYAGRIPAVPVAIAVFAVVQVLVPHARWNPQRSLSAGNLAVLLFGAQLVVLPVLLAVTGPTLGSLSSLPSDHYINEALLVQSAAYLAYAVGRSLLPRRTTRNHFLGPDRHRPRTFGPPQVAVAFVVVGAIGMVLAFPTPSSLIAYFSGQGDVFSDAGGASTPAGAAATFLRPFLAVGLVVLWAGLVRDAPTRWRRILLPLPLVVAVLAASATYGYNRTAVVVPVLCFITAYSMSVARLRMSRVVVLLVVLGVLVVQFGEYRSVYFGTEGGQISTTDAGLDGPRETLSDTAQVYGGAAQFWAIVIADADRHGYRGGPTLVGSALYPVPVLGKPFRDDSGPVLYNELIYGRSGVTDQNIVFGAELYWNGGVLAVIGGYLLLGLAVRRLDDLAATAADPLATYIWTYCGIWVASLSINSLSVLAQIVVYFMPPVVLLVLTRMTIVEPSEAPQ